MDDRVGGSWGTYRRMAAAQLRAQAQYRGSFALELGMLALFAGAELLEILVLFRVTDSLGGFGLGEVLYISSSAATGFALADLFVGNVERLKFYVRTGLLDAMIIRPRSVLGQLLVVDFEFRRVVRVLFSATVLGIVAANIDIDWTWWKPLLLVGAPLCGAIFFAAVFISTATVAFWWIESGELANTFTYGGHQFATYPVNIYGGFFRAVFAFGMGFAFVAYYPALPVLGVTDPLGMPEWFALLTPVVAALAAGLAATVWRIGLRHYKGTGS